MYGLRLEKSVNGYIIYLVFSGRLKLTGVFDNIDSALSCYKELVVQDMRFFTLADFVDIVEKHNLTNQ